MNLPVWLLPIISFLNLIPGALFCYLPMKNQLRFSGRRIFLLCAGLWLIYAPAAAMLSLYLNTYVNYIFMLSLVLFFFFFQKTVKTDVSRTLSVITNACALLSFPSISAYVFDAYLHPESGAAGFSAEAGLFQLALSIIMVLLAALPLRRYYGWMLDSLDIPKVWYTALMFPAMLFLLNMLMIPRSYQTLYTGRILPVFFLLELILILLLLFFYLVFYHTASMILEHAHQEEAIHFLEIQAEQYEALQNHIQQTRQLRHDFRHLVHGMTGLADSGDFETLRLRLHEYQNGLELGAPVYYCLNAALNALFNYYKDMAASEGIRIDWNIQIPEPLTISELDLCSLLGNLLENAAAGCRTVPEEQRFFCLSIVPKNAGCLYIVSTNSFDGRLKKDQKGYLSTKHGGSGIGLFSIKAIAGRYGGTVQISDSGQKFFVNIMLKI